MSKNLNLKKEFVNTKNNYKLASNYLHTDWDNMLQVDKDSWSDNSYVDNELEMREVEYTLKGKLMFFNYFMKTCVYDNTVHYNTATLSPGTGNDYGSRATRIWNFT